jgi:hypothetical protein
VKNISRNEAIWIYPPWVFKSVLLKSSSRKVYAVNFLPPRHFGRRGDRNFSFRVERKLEQENLKISSSLNSLWKFFGNFLWSPWRPRVFGKMNFALGRGGDQEISKNRFWGEGIQASVAVATEAA